MPTTIRAKAVAEKLFAELGLAPALGRRYAKLAEIPKAGMIWQPTAQKAAPAGGVFSHLRTKQEPQPEVTVAGATTMTWSKFVRTVLPTAQKIEAKVPTSLDRFAALVTAQNEDAPTILQWDREDSRNPFSWYYKAGADAEIRRRVMNAGGQIDNVDIRCSLIWNNRYDLDLHCITPKGHHIYYHNKRACPYGGFLDVDMNVSGETNSPVENIRWASGHAQPGVYKFFVNLYARHGLRHYPSTPVTVELEVNGQIFTFHHSVSAVTPGGMGELIAQFNYTPGVPVHVETNLASRSSVRDAAPAPVENAWNVLPNTFVPVTAIVKSPNAWEMPANEEHAFFILEGCRDSQKGVGRGFYTQHLRGELHRVRQVLEAYAKDAEIAGADTADACGLGISTNGTGGVVLRVNGASTYVIDRWD